MLFNSIEYAYLLIGAFTGFWLLARYRRPRVLFLLAVSYFFYGNWSAKYLALIFFTSSWDYFVGHFLSRTEHSGRRKALIASSLVVNLGILCVFKYFNFFSAETALLLRSLGVNADPFFLDVLLPVGISFYTFQSLSYAIDVYRRKMQPANSYFEYLLFVSFFPQLVAGPIVRAADLLPQFGNRPRLTAEQGSRAVFRIAIGLAKKVAIADFLGIHIVDPVFSNPEMYSSVESLVAIYAYAFQIYADFSAYSDIAIGSAALLGFHIPENFDSPYRAGDLREFWRRWHISLSTWLRDYLYIPLGGSKSAGARTYFNLLITMLLGGLWHGASMTFLAWGAIHGVSLAATRAFQRHRKRIDKSASVAGRALSVFLTFNIVCAAWVFFRSSSFGSAAKLFESMASLTWSTANISFGAWLAFGAAIVTHWIPGKWMEKARVLFSAAPAPVQAAFAIAVILLVGQVARTEVTPFIYFQF